MKASSPRSAASYQASCIHSHRKAKAHNECQDNSRTRHIIARSISSLLLLAAECSPTSSWRLFRMSALPGSLESSVPHYSRCIGERARREESWYARSHVWSKNGGFVGLSRALSFLCREPCTSRRCHQAATIQADYNCTRAFVKATRGSYGTQGDGHK